MTEFESSWNEYWQSGLSTSCVSNGQDGYPPSIEKFWHNFFRILRDGNRIVDLCSGGGGVPKLILDNTVDKDLQLEINLTDLAVIQNRLDAREGISLNYISECNCENLPFDDGVFDIVTSSFGIEYSDLDKTIKEINRVLTNGGYLSAVIHTYDSEIVKNSNKQMQQGFEILNESPFFELFKKIYQVKNKSKVFQRSAEQKLLNCLDEIKTKILHDESLSVYRLILKSAHDIFVFGQTNKPSLCVEYINKMQKALDHNYQRMKNLSEVVLSSQDIDNLINQLKNNGFIVNFDKKIVNDDNKVLGLGLICKKQR